MNRDDSTFVTPSDVTSDKLLKKAGSVTPSRPVGRPRKKVIPDDVIIERTASTESACLSSMTMTPVKRGRGRPRKYPDSHPRYQTGPKREPIVCKQSDKTPERNQTDSKVSSSSGSVCDESTSHDSHNQTMSPPVEASPSCSDDSSVDRKKKRKSYYIPTGRPRGRPKKVESASPSIKRNLLPSPSPVVQMTSGPPSLLHPVVDQSSSSSLLSLSASASAAAHHIQLSSQPSQPLSTGLVNTQSVSNDPSTPVLQPLSTGPVTAATQAISAGPVIPSIQPVSTYQIDHTSQPVSASLVNAMTQSVSAGLVNPMTQSVSAGLVNPMTQSVSAGLVNSMTQSVSAGLVNPMTQSVSAGLLNSVAPPASSGLVNSVTNIVSAGLVNLASQPVSSILYIPGLVGTSQVSSTANKLGLDNLTTHKDVSAHQNVDSGNANRLPLSSDDTARDDACKQEIGPAAASNLYSSHVTNASSSLPVLQYSPYGTQYVITSPQQPVSSSPQADSTSPVKRARGRPRIHPKRPEWLERKGRGRPRIHPRADDVIENNLALHEEIERLRQLVKNKKAIMSRLQRQLQRLS